MTPIPCSLADSLRNIARLHLHYLLVVNEVRKVPFVPTNRTGCCSLFFKYSNLKRKSYKLPLGSSSRQRQVQDSEFGLHAMI